MLIESVDCLETSTFIHISCSGVSSDCDDRDSTGKLSRCFAFTNLLGRDNAVHDWHLQVHQNNVKLVLTFRRFLQDFQTFYSVIGNFRLKARQLQLSRQDFLIDLSLARLVW